MHRNISVAVPTRHRWKCLKNFIDSFMETSEGVALTVMHDSPEAGHADFSVEETDLLCSTFMECYIRSVLFPHKMSLTELYNQGIIMSPTDWVLLCNDDIIFKSGWLEYLEQQIETGKYDIINLFHFGATLMHKSVVLKLGWWDESFRGGGFEDVSFQLKMSESNMKDRIDTSHDFIRREGGREIGHFVDHLKFEYKAEGWQGCNNSDYLMQKWGRSDPWNWKLPSYRRLPEIDWHPAWTKRYEEKFEMKSRISYINENYLNSDKEIYP